MPLAISLAEYQAMRADPLNAVEQGSQIRTVGQFFHNGEPKNAEFVRYLAKSPEAKGNLFKPSKAERKQAEQAIIACNPGRQSTLRGSTLEGVFLRGPSGPTIVGVLVKPKRGLVEMYAYYPTQTGDMRLQFHAAARG